MASIEKRGSSSRIVFVYKKRRSSFNIGEVDAVEAHAWKCVTEKLLRELKARLRDLNGESIERFLFYRGNPPPRSTTEDQFSQKEKPKLTLLTLRDNYFASPSARRLEANTRMVAHCHFRHLMRILGEKQVLNLLNINDLQKYIVKREGERTGRPIVTETIRKEIKTLRVAWNWARKFEGLEDEFPGKYLVFPKKIEGHSWMPFDEAEQLLAAGQVDETVFESVYLLPSQTASLLEHVREQTLPAWVWPLFVCAANTGARRSELFRAFTYDVKKERGILELREKKRDFNAYTKRQVPLTPILSKELEPFLKKPGLLFRTRNGQPIKPSLSQKYFHKALRGSRWQKLRGWHIFRHSYISALASKGVDQRLIDELVGHSTEEQRRRYRHIFPDDRQKAVLEVLSTAAPPSEDMRIFTDSHCLDEFDEAPSHAQFAELRQQLAEANKRVAELADEVRRAKEKERKEEL